MKSPILSRHVCPSEMFKRNYCAFDTGTLTNEWNKIIWPYLLQKQIVHVYIDRVLFSLSLQIKILTTAERGEALFWLEIYVRLPKIDQELGYWTNQLSTETVIPLINSFTRSTIFILPKSSFFYTSIQKSIFFCHEVSEFELWK